MSVVVRFNNTSYNIPSATNETGWGAQLTSFLQDVGGNAISTAGGTFPLTSQLDLGTGFGIATKAVTSKSSNPAAAGTFQLSNSDTISFRNNANNGDLAISVNASDQLVFNGTQVTPTISNPMSVSGDMIYGGNPSGGATRLAGNTTTTKKFLNQTGDGVNSAPPSWGTIATSDLAGVSIPNGNLANMAASTIKGQSASGVGVPMDLTVAQVNTILTVAANAQSSSYALTPNDQTVIFTTGSSSLTATFPTAIGVSGKRYTIKKGDSTSGTIVLRTTSSQTIDGNSDGSLFINTVNEALEVESDGSNWTIISHRSDVPWTSYQPSISGFGTTTSNEFYWRRRGDSLELLGKFVVGTPTADEARVGLPSGFVSDSSKIPSIRNIGHGDSTQKTQAYTVLIESGVAYVTFGQELWSGSGGSPLAKQTGSAIDASSDTFSFFTAGIPINKWF